MKKLILLVLMLAFFVGGGSLRTFALVTVPSQDFNLGAGVTGQWNHTTQELNLIGSGKMNLTSWSNLKNSLNLTTADASDVTIKMASDIQFPDVSNDFFYNVKSKIELPATLDVSNITQARRMFQGATNFNAISLDRSLPNLMNATSMFAGTLSFSGRVHFTDLKKLQSALYLFDKSSVKEVQLDHTENLSDARLMFSESKVEKVSISDMRNVTQLDSFLSKASNFRADAIVRDLPKVVSMAGTFFDTTFTGNVHLTNTINLTSLQSAFFNTQIKEVRIDHTENVTNMGNTFFKSKIEKVFFNDTSKVKAFIQTFWLAENFNSDISHWSFNQLAPGVHHFVNQNTRTFSRENYDALLSGWATRLPTTPVSGTVLGITSNYCFGKEARDQIIAKGYRIQGDRLDCNLELELVQPTKISGGDIVDTEIYVRNLRPLDPAKVKIIINPATMIGYSDFSCVSNNADATELKCGIKITSTPNGGNSRFTVQATDAVGTVKTLVVSGYLIDRIAPAKGQLNVSVDPLDDDKATVTMSTLPTDTGGAGLDHCELVYTGNTGTEIKIGNIVANTVYPLEFQNEPVHTINLHCYDKAGNFSTNEFKFPPVITFDPANITLSSGVMNGKVMVYSPSSFPLTAITLDPQGTAAILGICTSQVNGGILTSSTPLQNTPEKPAFCEFSNVIQSGSVLIKAKDQSGAEGQNSQSFIRDLVLPALTFTSTEVITGGSVTIRVNIFDAVGVQSGKVSIGATNLDTSNRNCTQIDEYNVQCSLTTDSAVVNGSITVYATDNAGNTHSETSSGYIIDKTAPTISNLASQFQNSGTKLLVSFSGSDGGGAGLWRQSESGNPQFDYTAISYGLASDALCSDYVSVDSLTPQETEPYDLSFEFDDVSKNGKYLCIVLKDKVGNTQTGALSAPLNLNLAPSFPAHTATIAENSAIGSLVSLLTGSDANVGDTLTYTIVEGNTGAVFSTQNNRLVVNGTLDYETLSGYRLIIQVSDQRGLFGTGEIEIELNDVDDEKPKITSASNLSYPQGSEITPIIFTGNDNLALAERRVEGLPAGLNIQTEITAHTGTLQITGTLSAAAGIYNIKVFLKDTAGNEQEQTFTLTIIAPSPSTPTKPGYSGGGGSNLISQTKSQNADSQTPAQSQEKVTFQDSDLFNPTIEDGKCYFRRAHQGIQTSATFPTTEEFNKALSFLWSYEMTMFDSVEGYAPQRNLTRAEAAKIFSNFAMHVLCRTPNTNLKTSYSDIAEVKGDLRDYIELAFQLGLMKGADNGKGSFAPFAEISRAEVNAVLIRMILKAYLDENQALWYQKYNDVATQLGIITQGAGLQAVLRNDIALMLFRAYKNQTFDRRDIDYFSYVLKTRELFVK